MTTSGKCAIASLLLSAAAAGLAAQSGADTTRAESLVAVLPVVTSTPGAFGSYFKTAVQVHNPASSPLNFRLVFHPTGRSGASSDPSYALSVAPHTTRYFADMLPAMGVASGIGSLDVYLQSGASSSAVAAVRVFNDSGAAGTSGFTEEFVSVDDAIGAGQEGHVISPPDFSGYRFNIGVRTLDAGATLRITVRNSSGVVTSTLTRAYAPNFFEQSPANAFLEGAVLSGSECLTFEVLSGAAVVYGATADNRTNDPSYQMADKLVD